ncbi:16S rRNA m(7)G-527 methyltransferase [Thalassoporum mexicanum PCC 7367]|uniref:16S rRNA (guanine(527)-N(7))-methyltransferase RsmG n=1 Tax=Thalassoporum mexicanum TaxID=3457544 RepID=UPI00029FE5A0|nr:16S rRNA (guanine(527)-N(7))-methyltransferase RsmG [Pseudanabaena sp. PCC 7367]AFY69988.1 16S rRNA m(7)G-527 methyltransferase [Pseudanabaena sp. PCC 7367]
MFEQFFRKYKETLSWQPKSQEIKLLDHLYQLVLEGNEKQNLTRITEKDEFWEKHIWDSLRGVTPIWEKLERTRENPDQALEAIDIGSGAGFPGLPIAIAKPDWQVRMLDSKLKKVNFINTAIKALGIDNAHTLLGRAESINRDARYTRKYDLVLVRAVGSVILCAKYAIPFLRSGGMAVLYRGQWTDAEQDQLFAVCQKSAAKIMQIDSYATPISNSVRHCIYLKKR